MYDNRHHKEYHNLSTPERPDTTPYPGVDAERVPLEKCQLFSAVESARGEVMQKMSIVLAIDKGFAFSELVPYSLSSAGMIFALILDSLRYRSQTVVEALVKSGVIQRPFSAALLLRPH